MDPLRESLLDDSTRAHAHEVWNYLLGEPDVTLKQADFVLALGSGDTTVAERAAEIVLARAAPVLVVSGGYGKAALEPSTSDMTEAERYAAVARQSGVSPDKIVLERRARNTGENITYTRDLLKDLGYGVGSGILVAKPYMRRRALATAEKQWREIAWQITSPKGSFDDYMRSVNDARQMLELMVGDLQRMRVYSRTGFQTRQSVPSDVWLSYEALVRAGFTKYVLVDE